MSQFENPSFENYVHEYSGTAESSADYGKGAHLPVLLFLQIIGLLFLKVIILATKVNFASSSESKPHI